MLADCRRKLPTAAACSQPIHPAVPFLSSYLSWDDYFMAVAFLSAQRSKDPNKQACSSRGRLEALRPPGALLLSAAAGAANWRLALKQF